MTLHVDNFNPDTYLWILQECDVPYVPDEWHKLMETYCKDPSKVTGVTILGRYISKMRLKQWKDYRWKDTEFLQELANAKIEQAMKRQGYGAAEITQAIEKATAAAKKNLISVPIVGTTIPHEIIGKFSSSSVHMFPAPQGTGVIAGGSARAVVELAGIKDIVTKSHGSNNKINGVKATIEGLKLLRTKEEVAALRGKSVEEL